MHLSRSLSAHLIWRSLGLISNFIITVLLSRLLTAADSGQFFYFLSWLSLLVLIGSLGIEPSVTYFLASKKMNKQDVFPIALYWIAAVIGLTGILGLIANACSFFSADAIKSGFFFIAGQLMINFFTAFFYGEHKFIQPARIVFFFNLTYIIFLSCLHLLNLHSFTHQLITDSYIILVFLQGICMLASIMNDNVERFRNFKINISIIKTLFRYSLPVFVANISIFLAMRIDYWILNHFKQDPVSVGNYIQVSRIAQLFQLYPSMLAAFLFPAVAAGKEQMNVYIIKLTRIVLGINLMLILLIAISGKFLFPFLFGKSFSQMYPLFILMIPGIISLSLLAIVSTYFSGNNRVIVNLSVSLLGLVGIFVGNWFLVPLYGIRTAPVVSSVGYSICFLITWLFFSIKSNNRLLELFAFKRSDFVFSTQK